MVELEGVMGICPGVGGGLWAENARVGLQKRQEFWISLVVVLCGIVEGCRYKAGEEWVRLIWF